MSAKSAGARPAAAGEAWRLSATGIAQAVREGALSPVQVIEEHLARIDAVEPALRAFQVVLAEKALADAQVLAGRGDLRSLPLAGVPVAVKDNIDVAGAPTRRGSAATSQTAAGHDDEVVSRLKAAGCVVIGKTQLPELAIWPVTEPSAFASTANPWDTSKTPGGSTGGGAAAVASGMAALALGSDGGGSIRIPAACCGLVGIKPGPGVVPLPGGAASHWHGMTAIGPLARSVADVSVALDVLAGATSYTEPGPPARPLRIAVSTRHPTPGARISPAVRRSVLRAAEVLRDAGHDVVHANPPLPATLGSRFIATWLSGIAQDARGLPPDRLEQRTRKMASAGTKVARWVRAVDETPYAAQAAIWFAGFDALLMAVTARPAIQRGSWTGKSWVTTTLSAANWVCTPPWNVAGLPAASVPFGGYDGLPVGVQIVAPAGAESTVLALAAQIERLHPWSALAPL